MVRQSQAAIGRYYGIGGGPTAKTDIQIVGVVRDVKHSDLRTPAKPTGYLAIDRDTDRRRFDTTYYLRTSSSPDALMSSVRGAVQQIDPKLVLDSFHNMDDQIDTQLTTEKLVTFLATSFGVLATLLCAIGLYGVLAFSATQRTREIGIRMALGADRMAVLRMMLGEVGRLLLISFVVAVPGGCGWAPLEQPTVRRLEPRSAHPTGGGGHYRFCGACGCAAAGAESRRRRAHESAAIRIGNHD